MEQDDMNHEIQLEQVAPAVQDETPESERNYDREYCPACGSKHTYWNEDRRRGVWLGLGEFDWCIACGATYEHSASWNKKPLTDLSIALLVQEARNVENAYSGPLSAPMTQEQIIRNREYFRRLITTIASSKLDHIPDRVEQFEAAERWETLRTDAATLMEELHGMGRTFYKNASAGLSEAELIAFIDDLKAKKAEAA